MVVECGSAQLQRRDEVAPEGQHLRRRIMVLLFKQQTLALRERGQTEQQPDMDAVFAQENVGV